MIGLDIFVRIGVIGIAAGLVIVGEVNAAVGDREA